MVRRGSAEYHRWVRGFYTDEKNRVRPITRRTHHRRIKRTPSLKLPPRRIRPVQVKPTVTGHARPKTTLENPMLYRNFMKNLRAKVDPDSWDKVDWVGEVDKSLEVAEAENQLRLKYPIAFKAVESQPTKTEIKELIVRREAEEKRVEEDLESAKKHGQIMTPEELAQKPRRQETSPDIRRQEIRRELDGEADRIKSSVNREISQHGVIGIMSDLGLAMHVEPKEGVLITINGIPYVFKENKVPTNEEVKRWTELNQTAERLRKKAVEYIWYGSAKGDGITIGNFKVVEKGRELRAKGLLSDEEDANLRQIERFWAEHPNLDKQHGSGVYTAQGTIKVIPPPQYAVKTQENIARLSVDQLKDAARSARVRGDMQSESLYTRELMMRSPSGRKALEGSEQREAQERRRESERLSSMPLNVKPVFKEGIELDAGEYRQFD